MLKATTVRLSDNTLKGLDYLQKENAEYHYGFGTSRIIAYAIQFTVCKQVIESDADIDEIKKVYAFINREDLQDKLCTKADKLHGNSFDIFEAEM